MTTPSNAVTIANRKLEDLGLAVYQIEKALKTGNVSKDVDIEASLKKLDRSFWRLDGMVRKAFEENLWTFQPRLLARLIGLVFRKDVSARVSKRTGNLLLYWNYGRTEIRRNEVGNYAAYIPVDAPNGGKVLKVILASNLINCVSQIVDFVNSKPSI